MKHGSRPHAITLLKQAQAQLADLVGGIEEGRSYLELLGPLRALERTIHGADRQLSLDYIEGCYSRGSKEDLRALMREEDRIRQLERRPASPGAV